MCRLLILIVFDSYEVCPKGNYMSNRSSGRAGAKIYSDSKHLPTELGDEQWSLISGLFPDRPMGVPVCSVLRARINARNEAKSALLMRNVEC